MRSKLRSATAIHYLIAVITAIQLIIFDAGRLMPPEAIFRRWLVIGIFVLINTFVWYTARNGKGQPVTLKRLTALLITLDLALASFAVYSSRGMASKAVAIYFVAVITSGILERRSAILATTFLAATSYVITCVAYFVFNFNEGYKIELYGETGYYAALIILTGLFYWKLMRPASKKLL